MMPTTHKLLPLSNRSRQQGLTLIEILVAVVILSIGLLGLAGLQVLGLKNITVSGTQAQAALLTNELAERIRVNRDDADDYIGLTNSTCPSTANVAQRDYCDIYAAIIGDSDKDGTGPDTGEVRLLRPPAGNYIVITEQSSSVGTYNITLNWIEQDFSGNDQAQSYGFNMKP